MSQFIQQRKPSLSRVHPRFKLRFFVIAIGLLGFMGIQNSANAGCRLCGHHFEKLPAAEFTMELIDEVDPSIPIDHLPMGYINQPSSIGQTERSTPHGNLIPFKVRDVIIMIPASAIKDVRWTKIPAAKSNMSPKPRQPATLRR